MQLVNVDLAPLALSNLMQTAVQSFSPSKKMSVTRSSSVCRRSGMCLAALVLLSMVASPVEASHSPNPVRRVLNMLQMMQRKVQIEGENQEKLFNKYMCFCQTSLQTVNSEIVVEEAVIPQVDGEIKEETAEKASLGSDVVDATADYAEAEKALKDATALRTKENKEFTATDAQMKVDIKALKGACKSMDKLGEGSGFLQLGASITSAIQRLAATSVDLSSADRDVVTAFLSEATSAQDGTSDGLAESSPAEITGILKQMAENMDKELAKLGEDEKNAKSQYESLKAAKESQMVTLKKEIQTKTERKGKVGIVLVEDVQKLGSTKTELKSDNKVESALSKECKARHREYDEEAKTRAQEMAAITDTIAFLNNDAATQLFKKTMSSPVSFLQLQVAPTQLKGDALAALQSSLPSGKRDPRIELMAIALRSKKTSFTKVLQMMDDMIALLNKEMKNDADKKVFCESEIGQTSDQKAEIDQAISDLTKAVTQTTSKLQSAKSDIKSKTDGVVTLDKQVAEAKQNRREEHQDYQANLQANGAAKSILNVATNRLASFYNKQAAALLQVKAPPHHKTQVVGKALKVKSIYTSKRSAVHASPMSETGKASLSALFDVEGAFSFAQVGMQTDVEDKPTYAAAKKRDDGKKVVALIGSLIDDIDTEVKEMTRSENEAQSVYESALQDSAEKRAGEVKAISQLEGFKAEAEMELHNMMLSVKDKTKESAGKGKYLKDLHKTCDWLVTNFKIRKSARTSEIDAIQKAKQVLTGADAGFLQVSMRTWRGLRSVAKHI